MYIWNYSMNMYVLNNHCQLSRTCLIGSFAYQQIDEKFDVNRKCSISDLVIDVAFRNKTFKLYLLVDFSLEKQISVNIRLLG